MNKTFCSQQAEYQTVFVAAELELDILFFFFIKTIKECRIMFNILVSKNIELESNSNKINVAKRSDVSLLYFIFF